MKHNVLIILPWLPYPLNTGGNQATFNCIEALKNDIQFHIAFMTGSQEQERCLKKLWPDIKFYRHNRPKPKGFYAITSKIIEKLERTLFKNILQYKIEKSYIKHHYQRYYGFIEFINNIIEEHHIDIVQMEFMETIDYVYAIPDKVKKIFIHHELGYVRKELYLKSIGVNNELYYKYIYRQAKQKEIGTLNYYDAVITVSSIDAEKLKRDGVTSEIIPSFCIVQNKYSFKQIEKYDKVLTFVGPENHPPNKIGITCFLDNVWPSILEKEPCMKLKIIGNWTETTQKDFYNKYKGLQFTGFVKDLQQELLGTIMIVPITIGSGIRMKIQEAAKMGIPVITTTVGVEGIPFENRKECIIEDEPEKFAEAILKLNSIQDQQILANAAYKKITEIFGFEALRQSRLPIYKKLANG